MSLLSMQAGRKSTPTSGPKHAISTPERPSAGLSQALSSDHEPEQAWDPMLSLEPLARIVDQAAARIEILRTTLDEASAVTDAVRAEGGRIEARVDQAERCAEELEARLARADESAKLIERARETLEGLESLVRRIKCVEQESYDRLAALIHEHEQDAQGRLRDLESRFDQKLKEASRGIERLEERFSTVADKCSRTAEQQIARLEQHADDVRGRVDGLIDDAMRRLSGVSMEHRTDGEQAEMIRESLEGSIVAAVEVLGYDPRGGDRRPAEGSLAHVADRAAFTLRDAAGASTKLLDVADRAQLAELSLKETIDIAREQHELLETSMGHATEQASSLVQIARSVSRLTGGQAASPRAA